jgi:hypothetical protein
VVVLLTESLSTGTIISPAGSVVLSVLSVLEQAVVNIIIKQRSKQNIFFTSSHPFYITYYRIGKGKKQGKTFLLTNP